MADLTPEEYVALRASPLCIRCNHRGLLHHEDYDSSMNCRVCDCEDFMAEGAFSHWHPPSYYSALANEIPNLHIERKMLAIVDKYLHLTVRSKEQ
jgi:hypothetical protein